MAYVPASTTRSQSQPIRRACSTRSSCAKPRSLLRLARTASALKCTPFNRGTSAVASVVLPAPGRPMMRIFFAASAMTIMPHVTAESCSAKLHRPGLGRSLDPRGHIVWQVISQPSAPVDVRLLGGLPGQRELRARFGVGKITEPIARFLAAHLLHAGIVEIMPNLLRAEDRIFDDFDEFPIEGMIRIMDCLAPIFLMREGDVLQPLEDRKVSPHPCAEVHERAHLAEVVELVREGKLELWDCLSRAQATEKAHVLKEHVVLAQSAQLLECLFTSRIDRNAHRADLAVNAGKLVPLLFAEQRPVGDDLESEVRTALVVDELDQLARRLAGK